MEDSETISTPIATRHKLSKNDDTREVNQTHYRSMIGKLQYIVHRRPNIVLAIGIVAIFYANPKENHMMAIKRIMRLRNMACTTRRMINLNSKHIQM